MRNKNKKVNIIGYGFVGQANAIGLKRLGYDVAAFDIQEKENIYGVEEFNEIPLTVGEELPDSGTHIICIKEKHFKDKGKRIQEVGHIARVLHELKGKGTVILRTTALPRFIATLPFDFYWVEFLHERIAIADFLNPELMIVGRRRDIEFPFVEEFPNIYYSTPEEASHIKYLWNIWNAKRISFVNEFGHNLKEEGIDMDRVLKPIFQDQKYLRWGSAFGGNCLPKDTEAYLAEYPDLLHLRATIKANNIHKKRYPDLEPTY